MKISPQRIKEVISALYEVQTDLDRLHGQGEGKNGCVGWPECDCRLAEQIRAIVHFEDEWEYRAKRGGGR